MKGAFKKTAKSLALFVAVIMACGAVACSYNATPGPAASTGQIYLYGELHGFDSIAEKELELWREHYHKDNLRHLFVEHPYYTAEFLNLWMRADNDDILNALYEDWDGTFVEPPEFYQTIKSECPETVFHGTDIGHQRNTTGKRFIEYLEQNGLTDSECYSLAQEAIEQGAYFYEHEDEAYRENKLVENFVREFGALDGESVIGIYGGVHTGAIVMDLNPPVPCMADQLKEQYGGAVHSEYLPWLIGSVGSGAITINGREYAATFYGKQNIHWVEDIGYREFWHLEDAYDDFKDNPKAGYDMPCYDYPMPVATGQVFVIEYTKTDGSAIREYYRSDGTERDGLPTTEGFVVE